MLFKKLYKILICILLFALFSLNIKAQVQPQKTKESGKEYANKMFNFLFHYSYELPGADLISRYYSVNNIGFGGLFKTKQNWILILDASYQFGNNVNDNIASSILAPLGNSAGPISNTAGGTGTVLLGERGFNTFFKVGRIIPLSSRNKNSGFSFMVGGGFVSHKINISTPNNDVAPLTDNYKIGYDRLTIGWALTQFAGYHFQGSNRLLNFYLGFDIIEAFTKNVRGYDYDIMQVDNTSRLDIFYGPRIAWMIPVYLTPNSQDEFYFR